MEKNGEVKDDLESNGEEGSRWCGLRSAEL